MDRTAIMFDLDGTLADTLRDIAEAGNHMLRTLGRAPLPIPEYRYLAGQGLPWLVSHALETDDTDLIERGIAAFRSHYAEHAYDHTGPFPGVPELLDTLTQRGLTLAVLSNKPHDATREVVDRLFGRWEFQAVRGHQPDTPPKPDPTSALAIADELGVPAEQWVYVGDTKVDMLTGTRSGFHTVGVTWGFRDEAELREHGAHTIISSPMELLSVAGLTGGATTPARRAQPEPGPHGSA